MQYMYIVMGCVEHRVVYQLHRYGAALLFSITCIQKQYFRDHSLCLICSIFHVHRDHTDSLLIAQAYAARRQANVHHAHTGTTSTSGPLQDPRSTLPRTAQLLPFPLPSHSTIKSFHTIFPIQDLKKRGNLLLVDPVVLSRLPALDLAVLEPQGNLLLSVLDAVGAVAHVAADVEGVVAADGAGGGGERVGGAEDGAAGLDGVAAFPDHGADGAGSHV
jgi:hypothetical protein